MDIESEKQQMIWEDSPENMQIDPRRARFPFCIVWTPLPVLSWLIPFIGHIGICREDGVILDFAGPNFVCVDNFAFGAAARYLQIDVAKQCYAFNQLNNQQDKNQPEKDPLTWDEALRKSTQEFQHRSYNLLTCNCHSFVANAANRLGFCGGKWNVVSLAVLILLKGQWVSKAAILRSYLPFIIVSAIGVGLGGWSFVEFWCVLLLVLVGWFVVGSYCFKNLIHL